MYNVREMAAPVISGAVVGPGRLLLSVTKDRLPACLIDLLRRALNENSILMRLVSDSVVMITGIVSMKLEPVSPTCSALVRSGPLMHPRPAPVSRSCLTDTGQSPATPPLGGNTIDVLPGRGLAPPTCRPMMSHWQLCVGHCEENPSL